MNHEFFDGQSGVYYQPLNDILVYLERAGAETTYTFLTHEIKRYPQFFVWSKNNNGEKRCVNISESPLVWIGDL